MDDLTAIYDRRYQGGYRERLSGYEVARWRALEHFIGGIPGLGAARAVLDYGAGTGLHVELWQRLFPQAELHFCDLSSVALERLKARYPQHADRCALVGAGGAAFPSESFDAVVSVEVMEHVEDLDAYLGDIHRLLRPGGVFVFTTPCANRLSVEHVFNVLTRQIEPTREGYRRWRWEDPTHLRRLRSGEAAERLRRRGFQDVGFRFRAHLFSFTCSRLCRGPLRPFGERLMLLDYGLFRRLPNGASMIGFARK